jgi:hypothetical protein
VPRMSKDKTERIEALKARVAANKATAMARIEAMKSRTRPVTPSIPPRKTLLSIVAEIEEERRKNPPPPPVAAKAVVLNERGEG